MTAVAFLPQTLVDYAQVLGAVATSAAVIVTLFIANKRPKLKVTCDIRHLVWQGQSAEARPRYLVISAVNVGELQAVITGVGWTTGGILRKRLWAHQDTNVFDGIASSPSLPHQLIHAETATFFLPLQAEHDWRKNFNDRGMFTEVLTTRKSLDRLRAVVFTSVGKRFECRPSASALDMMWEYQEQLVKTSAARG